MEQKKKSTPIKKLIKKADIWFSQRIRLQNADENGQVYCYTCNAHGHWKQFQCGHFIRRGIHKLRFDPRNARVQCVGCNMFNPARAYPRYAQHIIADKGIKEFNWLLAQGKIKHQFTEQELRAIIQENKTFVENHLHI